MSELGEAFKDIRKERRDQKEGSRVDFAVSQLERLGYQVERVSNAILKFVFRGETVTLFPYTGWFTGKTVKDGRGIKRLLKQIRVEKK